MVDGGALMAVLTQAARRAAAAAVPCALTRVQELVEHWGKTPERARCTVALYDHWERVIRLNTESPGWVVWPWIAAHAIDHEIGHALHHRVGGDETFGELRCRRLEPWARDLARRHVSEYAATDGAEFCAETYAGLRAGRRYPDTVMDLYRSLGGP